MSSQRSTTWEYRPAIAFYGPLIPFFVVQAFRAKHECYFTTVNPSIYSGGIGLESKYLTLYQIPAEWRPASVLISPDDSPTTIGRMLQGVQMEFPLIVKPDQGARGLLVQRVETMDALLAYHHRYEIPFIAQEYIDYPVELGVLYYRFLGEQQGTISSLTRKAFLQVTGDGVHSLRQLIDADDRARRQLDRLQQDDTIELADIPRAGQIIRLGDIGNHCKGTQFIDARAEISARLIDRFDQIADQIPGFCYGRFDLRCHSLEDLIEGRQFSILELNGACSEPAHMYDATTMTYWTAIRDLRQHWRILRQIAVANRQQGARPMGAVAFLRALWQYRRQLRRLQHLQTVQTSV